MQEFIRFPTPLLGRVRGSCSKTSICVQESLPRDEQDQGDTRTRLQGRQGRLGGVEGGDDGT